MALSIEGLFVHAGGEPILRGVYVRAGRGEITAVFGENGAGKTTLLRSIAGQISVSSGITIIDDLRLHRKFRRKRFRRIGYLPENPMIPGDLAVERAAADFGLASSAFEEDEMLRAVRGQRVSQLSLGERRYFELMCLLALGRDYVVLDEPFSRIAPLVGERMVDRLRAAADGGTGILVTDHYYRILIDTADRAYFLRQGRCVELDPDRLGADLERLRYLPGR